MKTLEFEAELKGGKSLAIPPKIAARLPHKGHAKVILLLEDDAEDVAWRRAAYERFMRDDAAEDAVYDKYA